MKAIRVHKFGGPEVMKLEEVPDPTAGAKQAVIRLRAIGVNPVDTYIRAGTYGPRPFPFALGSDGAGVVETVGAGVTGFKPGDCVYVAGSLNGTYSEKALCDAQQIYPLPPSVSFTQGAAISIPYVTAYRALFQKAKAVAGEIVLIHGATGGVGLAALQFARTVGLNTIATYGSNDGRDLLIKEGARHTVNHGAPKYLEEIAKMAGKHGVDVILEMLANVNLGKDLTLLAKGGRVVVIGSRGPVEINPRDTMSRDSAILGLSLSTVSDAERVGIHSAIGAGLANGTLRPVVGREMPLADAPQAHKIILEPGAHGKIVLIP